MITKDIVHYIASLARLHVTEPEAERFSRNLEDILHYVEKLGQLDVSSVKPTSHVLNVENVFRQDEVLPSMDQEQALGFAIEKYNGFYKVPKVIE